MTMRPDPQPTGAFEKAALVGCYIALVAILGGLFAYAWGWLP